MRRMNLMSLMLLVMLAAITNCKNADNSTVASDDQQSCAWTVSDPDGDGWGWENSRSCRITSQSSSFYKACSSSVDNSDGDDWGFENGQSCRIVHGGGGAQSGSPQPTSSGGFQQYDTTYYPYNGEHYFRTVCGGGDDHGGMYFAVTEKSPLWSGSCNNDNWAPCSDSDCLGKWDRMPEDVKRWDNGQRMVREPSCAIPCGKRFRIKTQDGRNETTAVIYDACPSQHWNNRFKEVTEGRNPCASGAMHVDLRKPLYLHLNDGKQDDNIRVLIDSNPVN